MRGTDNYAFAGVASVKVSSELVCLVIVVLTIFPGERQAHGVKKVLRACGQDDAAVATLPRLWAAELIEPGKGLGQYGERAVTAAIATVPLHLVASITISIQEFMTVLAQTRAERRARRRGAQA